MNFFSEMAKRVFADTPTFFNKLKVFGGSLSALSLSLLAIPGIPVAITSFAGYCAVGGGVILAVAQMACTNAPEIPKK